MQLELSAHNLELDDKLRDYIEKKIGGLDRFVPRTKRDGLEARVRLEQDPSGREDNQYVCEVIMKVPAGPLVSKEAAINIYAAIDVVEAKLKAQLLKYKTKRFRLRRRSSDLPVAEEADIDLTEL